MLRLLFRRNVSTINKRLGQGAGEVHQPESVAAAATTKPQFPDYFEDPESPYGPPNAMEEEWLAEQQVSSTISCILANYLFLGFWSPIW